jgi:hypothetical protein
VTLGYAFDYLLISALVEGMPTQEAEGKESADDKTVDLATSSPHLGWALIASADGL